MTERGKIIEIEIGRKIKFNDAYYSKAFIEIDHINYGLDPNSKKLNTHQRSTFTAHDICQFLFVLDGMELMPGKEDENFSYFALELLCPVRGHDFGKKFRMIFTTSKNDLEVIGTITLYRVR